jgi:hypothetical protein
MVFGLPAVRQSRLARGRLKNHGERLVPRADGAVLEQRISLLRSVACAALVSKPVGAWTLVHVAPVGRQSVFVQRMTSSATAWR